LGNVGVNTEKRLGIKGLLAPTCYCSLWRSYSLRTVFNSRLRNRRTEFQSYSLVFIPITVSASARLTFVQTKYIIHFTFDVAVLVCGRFGHHCGRFGLICGRFGRDRFGLCPF